MDYGHRDARVWGTNTFALRGSDRSDTFTHILKRVPGKVAHFQTCSLELRVVPHRYAFSAFRPFSSSHLYPRANFNFNYQMGLKATTKQKTRCIL